MQIITKESYIGTITKEPENSFIEITLPHGKEVEFSLHEYKQGYQKYLVGHGTALYLYLRDVGFTCKKIVKKSLTSTVNVTYVVLK